MERKKARINNIDSRFSFWFRPKPILLGLNHRRLIELAGCHCACPPLEGGVTTRGNLSTMKIPDFNEERKLWKKGYNYVCGIDEVGRGPWAGPVVAAAVIFDPARSRIWSAPAGQDPGSKLRIRDSKQLSPTQREKLDPWIKQNCLTYSICETSVTVINREGIVSASQRAYRRCLKKLKTKADFILMDAFYIRKISKEIQKPIIKGDQKSISIAAASIIAKVYRDNLMVKLHKKFPQYHFDKHKGYGTKLHSEAIKIHGLSPHHRVEFVPQELTTTTK